MAYAPDAILPKYIAAYGCAYQQPDTIYAGSAYHHALYESWQQNRESSVEKLTIPVLAIDGSASAATMVEDDMNLVATDVTGAVAPECRHWIPEGVARMIDSATPRFPGHPS